MNVDNGIRSIHPFLINAVRIGKPEIQAYTGPVSNGVKINGNFKYAPLQPNPIYKAVGRHVTVTKIDYIDPAGNTMPMYNIEKPKVIRGGYNNEWLSATTQHRADIMVASSKRIIPTNHS